MNARQQIQKKYQETHREQLAEYQASYYQAHKEELRIKRQAYRDANRDKVKKWSRDNYLRRKEKMNNGGEINTTGQ